MLIMAKKPSTQEALEVKRAIVRVSALSAVITAALLMLKGNYYLQMVGLTLFVCTGIATPLLATRVMGAKPSLKRYAVNEAILLPAFTLLFLSTIGFVLSGPSMLYIRSIFFGFLVFALLLFAFYYVAMASRKSKAVKTAFSLLILCMSVIYLGYLLGLPYFWYLYRAIYSIPYVKPSGFNASASNSIQLILSIRNQSIMHGNKISIEMALFNNGKDTYNITALSGYNYGYNSLKNITVGSLNPCGINDAAPIEIALYDGHYGIANITKSMKPLHLYQPGIYFCPAVLTGSIKSYYFWPKSYNATIFPIPTGTKYGGYDRAQMLDKENISGFWSNETNASQYTFRHFEQGNYTVIIEDEWRQYGVGYFRVG